MRAQANSTSLHCRRRPDQPPRVAAHDTLSVKLAIEPVTDDGAPMKESCHTRCRIDIFAETPIPLGAKSVDAEGMTRVIEVSFQRTANCLYTPGDFGTDQLLTL